jgi:hypothetical protein
MIDLVVDTGLGDVPARLARTDADLAAMATWMRDRRDVVLGLDTETNAINPWDRDYRLRLIQISDGREAWLAEPSGAVRDMLRAHPTFVAHYSEAEIRFLGCGLPGAVRMEDSEPHIIDTQPILAFYDPRTLLPRKDGIDIRLIHPKGLKDTFTREFSPGLKQAEDALHAWFTKHAPVGRRTKKAAAVWGFANVPVEQPEYLTYGAFDAIAVKWLYDKMVAAPVVVRQLSHVVRAVARQWDIDRMTYRGLPVDPDYVRWLDKELIELIDINAQQLSGYGVPSSAMGDSIAAAFTNLGVSAVSKTKTGRPQWDKAALLVLLDTGVTGRAAELTSLILKSRQATKFRAAYVAPMLDALGRDGRVHCSFRTVGTVTHRDSAANPALQQLPKKDPRIRAAIGGVDGWVIVSADFAQGEPRVMAAHSGDPNYLAALNSGDINSAIAAESFGDAFHPADGKKAGTPSYLMRNAAKAGFLAYCYAVGDANHAHAVDADLPRAVRAWAAAQPGRVRDAALRPHGDPMGPQARRGRRARARPGQAESQGAELRDAGSTKGPTRSGLVPATRDLAALPSLLPARRDRAACARLAGGARSGRPQGRDDDGVGQRRHDGVRSDH